jgi:beta-glucosidase
MGWEIYPDGLYQTLKRIAGSYSGDTPIYITENGMASDDALINGEVGDDVRLAYLNDHIKAVARAADEGVPMRGYFAWSLLDNFEWSFGYEKRFGLVHVDYDTMTRTPKASYQALKAAIAS